MTTRFHALSQWGSFQKQLHNYGFEKQDRVRLVDLSTLHLASPMTIVFLMQGAGKALYAHPGNRFRKGRPDLLPKVLRRPNRKTRAFMGQGSTPAQERPTPPIEPTTPQPESQGEPQPKQDQLEQKVKTLKTEILELKSELERSEADHSAVVNRLQATENRLLAMENRLVELLGKLEWLSIRDGTLNSLVYPGTEPAVLDYGFLFPTSATPAVVDSFPAYPSSSSQSVLGESHLSMGIPYDPLDPSFSLALL